MIIPTNIVLLGRVVPVNLVDQATVFAVAGDKVSIGIFTKGEIWLSNTLPPDELKRVLTHEIVHAVLEISGANNILSNKIEEVIATAMEALSPYLEFKNEA